MQKTVIITGSSRGIGAQTARRFAQGGWNVVINYLASEQAAKSLCSELSKNAVPYKADVSNRADVENMISFTIEHFGRIDALINNAAISHFGLFNDIKDDELEHLLSVNLGGVFNCTKAVLNHMIHNKSGCILNLSSIWGITGASCEAAYSASKAAVIGFTKAMAKELGPSGIRVNCVAPGIIDTDMNRTLDSITLNQLCADTPLGRFGKSSDVAGLLYYLAGNEAEFITGQVISPNGGFLI